MSQVNIVDMEFLTKGSVWLTKSGLRSFVLCVTNTWLPPDVQEANPPVVVYCDDKGRISHKDVEDFLSSRKFYNVDPGLEARLDELIQISGDVTEEEALNLDEAPPEGSIEGDVDPTDFKVGFFLEDSENLANPVLTEAALVDAFVSYSEEPVMVPSDQPEQTRHRFNFKLGGAVSLATLAGAFDPSVAEANDTKLYAAFGTLIEGQIKQVDWDTFLGVYPSYAGGVTFGSVYLGKDVPQTAEDELGDDGEDDVDGQANAEESPFVTGEDETNVGTVAEAQAAGALTPGGAIDPATVVTPLSALQAAAGEHLAQQKPVENLHTLHTPQASQGLQVSVQPKQ